MSEALLISDAVLEQIRDALLEMQSIVKTDFTDRDKRREAVRSGGKLDIKLSNLINIVKPLENSKDRINYHEQLRKQRDTDGSVWEFKVSDYTTKLVGFGTTGGIMVVRGDGTTYFYADYRITERKQLHPFDATPANRWSLETGNGEDPHPDIINQERAKLQLGYLTDDELANAVFLHADKNPSMDAVMSGKALMPIVYLTAAKERIRWLSRKLEQSRQLTTALQSPGYVIELGGQYSEEEIADIAEALEMMKKSSHIETGMLYFPPGSPGRPVTVQTEWLKQMKKV